MPRPTNKNGAKMKSISITVPEELLAEIKEVAKQEHRSVSSLITVLIEQRIKEGKLQ